MKKCSFIIMSALRIHIKRQFNGSLTFTIQMTACHIVNNLLLIFVMVRMVDVVIGTEIYRMSTCTIPERQFPLCRLSR